MRFRKLFGLTMAALLLAVAGAMTASADDAYPSKPITLILPLGAGGSHDLNARVFTSVIPQYLNHRITSYNVCYTKLLRGRGCGRGFRWSCAWN